MKKKQNNEQITGEELEKYFQERHKKESQEEEKTITSFHNLVDFTNENISFSSNSLNKKESISMGIFNKFYNHLLSIKLLLDKGFFVESEILFRVSFESLVLLMNLEQDNTFLDLIEKKHVIEQRKHIFTLINNSNSAFAPLKQQLDDINCTILPNELEKLNRKLAEWNINNKNDRTNIISRFNVKGLAEKVDMATQYELIYSEISDDVHTNVNSLKAYLDYDINNQTFTFSKPDMINSQKKRLLVSISEYLSLGLKSLNNIFSQQFFNQNELDELDELDIS